MGRMCCPTWVVVLIDGDRGWLEEADFEALLKPEDQDLWHFVRHLRGGQGRVI